MTKRRKPPTPATPPVPDPVATVTFRFPDGTSASLPAAEVHERERAVRGATVELLVRAEEQRDATVELLDRADKQLEDVAEAKRRQQRGNRKRRAKSEQEAKEVRDAIEKLKQSGMKGGYVKRAAKDLGKDYETVKELLKTKKRP